jgi:peptidoglycan/LPS O-acetylase OafA/YrhL
MHNNYLPGLNSLRFFAAFLVIISHANQSLLKLGLDLPVNRLSVFQKGGDAVDFFFTLSGFLITYLLLHEKKETGTISLKNFYLRRVFRIWPVYFIVLAIGFGFFTVVYPLIFKEQFFKFNIWHGLLLFVFFLPNYAAKNYPVGLLNPLWSIGVEEQFYLFWAPLMKIFGSNALRLISIFIVASTLFSFAINHSWFAIAENWKNFLVTLKFHNMAVGSLFAYILINWQLPYNSTFLTHKASQALVIVALAYHYLVGFRFIANPLLDIFMSLLYGLLILNVSSIPNKLIDLEIKPLLFLGQISYGLYMYHMLADYVLRFLFIKFVPYADFSVVTIVLYHIILLALTIAIASFSFFFIERYFMALKTRFA